MTQILYKHTVFADVYRLRREGQKLPRNRLIGIRGRLRIERGGMVVGERDVAPYRSITASVHVKWPQPFPGHAEATLHGAKITRMDERGFVLTGREVIMNGLGAKTYPQAWFCVPVTPDDAYGGLM